MAAGQLSFSGSNCSRAALLPLIIIVVFVAGYYYYYFDNCVTIKKPMIRRSPVSKMNVSSTTKDFQLNIQAIVPQLDSLLQELEVAQIKKMPPSDGHIKVLRQALTQLDNKGYSKNKTIPKKNSSVCSEIYKGRVFGTPMFTTGWVLEPCTKDSHLKDIVSFVINPPFTEENNCSQYVNWIVKGVNEYYPGVSMYIANNSKCKTVLVEKNSNVRWIDILSTTSAGYNWMKLLKSVETPYVLVGRNTFHFTKLSQIERQIRVIEGGNKVMVIGGSLRNLTSHWRVGCFQTKLQNYVLEYIEGYQNSKNDCMFCDYLASPFLAKTKIFKEIPLDDSLPEDLLFRDFFLQLKIKGYLAQNCPDVMYFANDVDRKMFNLKAKWIPLVHKWNINRVLSPYKVKHVFNCEESNISCKARIESSKYYLLAPCCIKEYLRTLKAVHDIGLPYELEAGTVTGAVKMSGAIPWDIDMDVLINKADMKAWLSHKDKLSRLNISIEDHGWYIIVCSLDAKIDFVSVSQMSANFFLPNEMNKVPTLVKFDGEWVIGPVSPGLNARNRCKETLKHAQSYLHTGKGNEDTLYEPGQFVKCPQPSHHACIDHFATDGNIQFFVP